MSGSRLGRGRGGRLAVYGGCGVVALLLVFLYRAATSEMARLRDLHVQCAHQQEALAAQLQVIFEYKVRLEKSLAEEKSSNAAVKQELQQRATREKSLRDKDSIEAMQRFNSLQQTYKLLQTEHQDLQDECDKRQKQALEDTKRLEATLQELRSRIRIAAEEKESLKHLKNKYLELDTENTKLQGKYNELLKSNGNSDSVIDHLKKEVMQLKRELETAKKSTSKATSPGPSILIPQPSQQDQPQPAKEDPPNRPNPAGKAPPPQQPQVSRLRNDDENHQPPLGAPKTQVEADSNEEDTLNGANDAQFAQDGSNIVPVGPNEVKKSEKPEAPLPLPYNFRDKHQNDAKDDAEVNQGPGPPLEDQKKDDKDKETVDEEQNKNVLPAPKTDKEVRDDKKSSPAQPNNNGSLVKP